MRAILLFAAAGVLAAQDLRPIDTVGRIQWATEATVGPPNLAAGVFTSGIQTGMNKPPEYGPHWDGFAKRYGLRLTGSVTSNAMEAGLGAIWGEDPRYRAQGEGPIKQRIWHAVKSGFLAYNHEGDPVPAYARYAAISGSNALANTWRPDSQRNANDTMVRIGLGFAGRIAANSFAEFWPDVQRHVFRR